jgi:hypothetical protein
MNFINNVFLIKIAQQAIINPSNLLQPSTNLSHQYINPGRPHHQQQSQAQQQIVASTQQPYTIMTQQQQHQQQQPPPQNTSTPNPQSNTAPTTTNQSNINNNNQNANNNAGMIHQNQPSHQMVQSAHGPMLIPILQNLNEDVSQKHKIRSFLISKIFSTGIFELL